MAKEAIPIPLGVILDLNSTIGNIANSCIWMAHQDFYEHHQHYKTRVAIRTKDSGENVVTAASAGCILHPSPSFSPPVLASYYYYYYYYLIFC